MYREHCIQKLSTIRKEIGYTQQQVADITGIPRNTICRIETGTREPNLETLGKLIDFYEVSADWLLGTGKHK